MRQQLKKQNISFLFTLVLMILISGCAGLQKRIPEQISLTAEKINSDSVKISWKPVKPIEEKVFYQIVKTDDKTDRTEIIKGAIFKVYLKSDWQDPYMHFGGLYGWTNAPGVKMQKISSGEYAGCYEYTIQNTPFVSITFNDNGKIWDNNNGKNYMLTKSGIYFRDENKEGAFTKIGDLSSKGFQKDNYFDNKIKPSTEYYYKILAIDSSEKIVAESNTIKVISLPKEISIYPYLTWNISDSSTSEVVVNFQTESKERVTVRYGTDEENLNKLIKTQNAKIHHVKLSSLKPGTKYWYQICTDKLENEKYYFRTASNNNQKYSFIILNDMQDGVDYNTPQRRWTDIAGEVENMIKKEDICFIIAPGDLISNDSNINWKIFFDKGKNLLPYIVMMPVPGNHETGGDDAHDRNSSNFSGEEHFKEYFDLPGNENYYSFNFSNSLFIGLDTEELSDIKTFKDSVQYNWVSDILEKNAKSKNWVFVYQHIPAYSASARHQEQCIAVRPITEFFDGQVDWDFAAHMHNYQRFNPLRYNKENPGMPVIEKDYGRGKDQGVGYINLAPSGNKPERMANDGKGLLAFPTPENIENGTISEIGFTKVDVDKNEITITTYGLGDLVNKEKLHIYDKVSYNK